MWRLCGAGVGGKWGGLVWGRYREFGRCDDADYRWCGGCVVALTGAPDAWPQVDAYVDEVLDIVDMMDIM